jgi:hypothetical protein
MASRTLLECLPAREMGHFKKSNPKLRASVSASAKHSTLFQFSDYPFVVSSRAGCRPTCNPIPDIDIIMPNWALFAMLQNL